MKRFEEQFRRASIYYVPDQLKGAIIVIFDWCRMLTAGHLRGEKVKPVQKNVGSQKVQDDVVTAADDSGMT